MNIDRIFRENYKRMYNTAYRVTKNYDVSEDIVQNTLIRLWENRHSLRLRTSLPNYLTIAVKNGALDYLRKQKSREKLLKKLPPIGHTEIVLDPEAEQRELNRRVHRAIATLKPKMRRIVTLNKIEGLTCKEIATYLGVSPRTVESSLYAAKPKLRKALRQ